MMKEAHLWFWSSFLETCDRLGRDIGFVVGRIKFVEELAKKRKDHAILTGKKDEHN